jgi:hypothetical protein
MKRSIWKTLIAAGSLLAAANSNAFEVNNVSITQIDSFNSGGHLWVLVSGPNNCGTPSSYFIIERWDNQAEPLQTYRKQMYQMALTAFTSGKRVRVVGSTCYLGQYLFAEQLMIFD